MCPYQRNEQSSAITHESFKQDYTTRHQARSQAAQSSANPPPITSATVEPAPGSLSENAIPSIADTLFNEGGPQNSRSPTGLVFPNVLLAGASPHSYKNDAPTLNRGSSFNKRFLAGSVSITNTVPSSNTLVGKQPGQNVSISRFSDASPQTNPRSDKPYNTQIQQPKHQTSRSTSSFGVFPSLTSQNQQAVQRAIRSTTKANVAAFERFMVGEVELQQGHGLNSINNLSTKDLETPFANLRLGNIQLGQSRSLASELQRQPFGPTINDANNFGHFRNRSHTPFTAIASPSPFIDHRVNGNMTVMQPRPRFQPSDMLIRLRAQAYLPHSQDLRDVESGRYQGDANSRSFMNQVTGLADQFNCALWLTNISTTVTIKDIFDVIDCGAVFALHVNGPDANHACAAAKLIFKEPGSARQFYLQARIYGLWLHGRRIQVIYNRNGHFRWEGPQTRVLRVEGPNRLMTYAYWDCFFRNICVFSGDRVLDLGSTSPGKKTMEFRFERIDGQSQMCLPGILDHHDQDEVRAWYGPDPCDPVSRGLFNI